MDMPVELLVSVRLWVVRMFMNLKTNEKKEILFVSKFGMRMM